jgi:hypothetical protein
MSDFPAAVKKILRKKVWKFFPEVFPDNFFIAEKICKRGGWGGATQFFSEGYSVATISAVMICRILS